jgi:hypothetical protein
MLPISCPREAILLGPWCCTLTCCTPAVANTTCTRSQSTAHCCCQKQLSKRSHSSCKCCVAPFPSRKNLSPTPAATNSGPSNNHSAGPLLLQNQDLIHKPIFASLGQAKLILQQKPSSCRSCPCGKSCAHCVQPYCSRSCSSLVVQQGLSPCTPAAAKW